jgi:hypothetical protein
VGGCPVDCQGPAVEHDEHDVRICGDHCLDQGGLDPAQCSESMRVLFEFLTSCLSRACLGKSSDPIGFSILYSISSS